MISISVFVVLTIFGISTLCRAEAPVYKPETVIATPPQVQMMSQKTQAVQKKTESLTVKNLDLKKTIQSFGGADAGGGDIVQDGSGKYQLLDLIEKDELDYFMPRTYYGNLSQLFFTFLFFKQGICEDFVGIKYEAKVAFPKQSSKFEAALLSTFNLNMIEGLRVYDPCDVGRSWQMKAYYLQEANKQNVQDKTIDKISPLKWAFTNTNLEDLADEGLIRVDNPETKKQLAIQKDGLVVVSKNEFDKLDSLSKESLFIHEAVLFSTKKVNPDLIKKSGTEPVRAYVRRLVKFLSAMKTTPGIAAKEALDVLVTPANN